LDEVGLNNKGKAAKQVPKIHVNPFQMFKKHPGMHFMMFVEV